MNGKNIRIFRNTDEAFGKDFLNYLCSFVIDDQYNLEIISESDIKSLLVSGHFVVKTFISSLAAFSFVIISLSALPVHTAGRLDFDKNISC